MKKKLLFIVLLFVSSLYLSSYALTYYSKAAQTNPNLLTNWTINSDGTGANPASFTLGDLFIVQSGHNYTTTANWNISPSNLQIDGTFTFNNHSGTVNDLAFSGTLNINGAKTLTANGNVTMNSPSLLAGDNNNSTLDVAAGNLTINDGSAINGSANIDVNVAGNFICNAGAGISSIGRTDLTISGSTTINGDFTFIFSASGNKSFRAITVSATGIWDNTVGEDPRINGNIVNNGSWLGNTGGTADYQFGRTVVGSYAISGNPVSFSRVSIENGTTVTNKTTVTIDGSVNPGIRNRNGAGTATFINGDGIASAILYFQNDAASGADVTGAGLVFNAASNNNTVYYSRAGAQNIRIPDDLCYYNLVCDASGTKTIQAGTTGIKNLLTIQGSAIVDVGTNTVNDGCGGTPGLTMTGTSELIISKCATTVPELTGTYTLTGGTITLNGACAQTLRGGKTYYNLQLSGNNAASAVNMTGVVTINGDLTVSNATKISANSAFSMDCSKTFTYSSSGNTTLTNNINIGNFSHTNTGDVNDGGNTITVCGSSWDRSSATANFIATGRVIFNPSSGTCSVTSSAGANITQFRNLTINASKILVGDANGMNVGIGGTADWTNNGTFTHNSGTVTVVGNTTILGANATNFNNLIINNTFTLTGHATNMNIEGDWTNSNAAGGFTHNSGKVTFLLGNTQTITKGGTETFFNLTINKLAGTIVTSAVTTIAVTNLLTMTEGVFDVNTNTLNGAGGFTATGGDLQLAKLTTVPELTGTYTITGGTVTLDGAGAQTLRTAPAGASTYYNLVLTNSGAKTITGLLTINGDVTVSGSATIANTNSAFVQAADKTFNYFSTGSTTLNNGVAVTVGSYSQTNGTLILPNNAGNIFTVSGASWNKSGGTFTSATTNSAVKFQGGVTQTFTDNGTSFNKIVIDNGNGVSLNNDMTIVAGASALTFTNGTIITGTNYVTLTSTAATVITPGTGKFVDGNFKKAIAAGATTRTFEVGDGTDYIPVTITFGATTTAGNFTCAAYGGDHTDIYASTLDPGKTVNRNWKLENNSIGTVSYSATFTFLAGDVDGGCDVLNNVIVERYNGTTWNTTTIGTRTATTTQITGVTTPASGSSEYYQIGEDYNAKAVWTAVSNGTFLWSNKATWIQDRLGTISTTGVSVTVNGVGTKFTTELVAGDIIMLRASPATTYVVSSITSDVLLTLSAATTIASGAYGRQKVPDINDEVNIGNNIAALNGFQVTITMDMASTDINRLTFTGMGQGNTLTHDNATTLHIVSSAWVKQPNNANTNTWNINGGTVTADGNVQIGTPDNNAGRIAKINITTNGILNIGTNLVYSTTVAANAVLDMTGGAGRVNLYGTLTLNTAGTLSTAGTENIFNYCRSAGAQTVTFGSSIIYRNLYLNNTNAAGATLGAAVTAANVTGDIITQTGTFLNGGFAIAGNAARKFQVDNGASFKMTGTAVFPTIFGTFTFGATSNTYFLQTNAQIVQGTIVVTSPGYGNLYCQPGASVTQTLCAAASQTILIQSDLIIGDGVIAGTLTHDTRDPIVTIGGKVVIAANATLTMSNITASTFSVAGDFTVNGTLNLSSATLGNINFNGTTAQQINGSVASITFSNITVAKSAGTTLSVGGSVTTINTNNITMTSGTFDVPATVNLNATTTASTMTLNGGILNGGASTISLSGDWINNGGTFNGGTSTVTFTNGTNHQINGTAAAQTFNNININKSAGGVISTGGSTATITCNNFTISDGVFTAPATVNINGNLLVNGNNGADTYTSGTNTTIKGNITFNTGALTWGTNVNLTGTSQQTISGTNTYSNFTNLTINNLDDLTGQAILLSKPITLAGTLTLTDGHIFTDATNILTLTAAAPNPALNAPVTQDSSFVKGPMIQTKNTTASEMLLFPVGKVDNMHKLELTVAHSTVTSTTYTTEYLNSSATALGWALPTSPPNPEELTVVSAVGYWDISKGAGSSVTNGAVKLYYLASDDVTDAPNLRVAKGNPSAWVDIGGSGTGTPSGTITSTVNFTTFSRFSLANARGGGNALPVSLLSFNAELNYNSVDLTWITATEINNDYFTIEKTRDGNEFEEVTKMKGAGNSSSVREYKSMDENPYKGISYYRLKQTDFDGKFSYSDLVAINNIDGKEVTFTIFPNPSAANSNVNVSITGYEKNEEVLVVLNDISGKQVYSKLILTDDNGSFVTAIDPQKNLPAGIYLVVGSSRNDIYSRKLVIK